MTALFLASGQLLHKTWWNPYMKGALITAFAVALFCGSAYLLLYTDVGSRLGFLLTLAAMTGWLAVNSLAWISSQFPNGPLGRIASWPAKEQVASLAESRYERIRTIEALGQPTREDFAGQIKADLDTELTDGDGELDLFGQPADYLVVRSLSAGGGRKWPLYWTEKTRYAATEICPVQKVDVPFGEAAPTPECDASQPTSWIVNVRDLGSRRLPSFLIFGGSVGLFSLTLPALRRYERDAKRVAVADQPTTP